MNTVTTALAYKPMREEPSGTPQLELEDFADFPERRLWVAIIIVAVCDYEEQLAFIRRIWSETGRPVDRIYLNQLRNLRHELNNPWFAEICELAGWQPQRVLGQLKRLEDRHGLSAIKFTETIYSGVIHYRIRRSKRRMHG